MRKEKIGVLIADDSPVVREVIKDMILDESDMEILGEAQNGRDAVTLAESLRPDIITMDVMMPIMNGLEAVEEIMAYTPTPILVFSSAVNDKEMDVAFQAIARGALDVMEKPKVPSGEKYDGIRRDFLEKLRMLSRIHVIPHLRGKKKKNRANNINGPEPAELKTGPKQIKSDPRQMPAPEPTPSPIPEAHAEIEISDPVAIPAAEKVKSKIVAVGSSTGGPKALVQIFRRIPSSFPLPVLSVQHIAPSFAQGLVAWLNRESTLRIALAKDKLRPEPGTMYVAPTGEHMIMEHGLLRMTSDPPVNSCRPSVDVLFTSVAEQIGERAVAVLLTGMGRDGAEGMKAVKNKNGKTMVQDQDSSVIFGMPKAAIELGVVDEVVPLYRIPEAIIKAIT